MTCSRAILTDRTRGGTSLLEMVLVIVIIAILAAIAAPRYAGSVGRYRAEMTARRIVADLSLARKSARAAGAARTVTFTPASNEYRIPDVGSLKNSSADHVVQLADAYSASLVSANFGGDAVVVFDAYGVPDSGGQVVVQAGSFQKTVVLNADSGKAKVQ